MVPSERICSQCGWRNEPEARMCGGCGKPLGTFGAAPHNVTREIGPAGGAPFTYSGAGGDVPTNYSPGGAYSPNVPQANAGDVYSPLAPTRSYDYGTLGTLPAPGAAAASWPAPAPSYQATRRTIQPAQRRGGSCLQRMLVTLLVLVVVTTCCSAGLWSFIIRPSLHTATDSQIRAGLDALFDEASNSLEQALPLLPKGNYRDRLPIKAADINAQIRAGAAKRGVPVDSEVHFIGTDSVQVAYLLSGKQHTVTTHLYIVNGRIRARDTTDDFPLNMWESNTELETTINEALTHLTPDLHVTELHMADDALHFSFTV